MKGQNINLKLQALFKHRTRTVSPKNKERLTHLFQLERINGRVFLWVDGNARNPTLFNMSQYMFAREIQGKLIEDVIEDVQTSAAAAIKALNEQLFETPIGESHE